MVFFDENWNQLSKNEFGADQASIRRMSIAFASYVLNVGVNLDSMYQSMIQFADEIVANDRNTFVTSGMHQRQFYRGRCYMHYTMRDSTRKAFHLYVLADDTHHPPYLEKVVAASELDSIDRVLVWLYT
jgi:hypothetical protein